MYVFISIGIDSYLSGIIYRCSLYINLVKNDDYLKILPRLTITRISYNFLALSSLQFLNTFWIIKILEKYICHLPSTWFGDGKPNLNLLVSWFISSLSMRGNAYLMFGSTNATSFLLLEDFDFLPKTKWAKTVAMMTTDPTPIIIGKTCNVVLVLSFALNINYT